VSAMSSARVPQPPTGRRVGRGRVDPFLPMPSAVAFVPDPAPSKEGGRGQGGDDNTRPRPGQGEGRVGARGRVMVEPTAWRSRRVSDNWRCGPVPRRNYRRTLSRAGWTSSPCAARTAGWWPTSGWGVSGGGKSSNRTRRLTRAIFRTPTRVVFVFDQGACQ
jgi:hypothetical protein